MASRLGTAGYYVMLPYLYYRGGPYREFDLSDEDMHARQELMGTVTLANIVGDAEALLAHAAGDPAARDGDAGVVGFCMSGGLSIAVARALPDRVAAAASIHGAWLVRDTDDSPHRGLDRVRAELYFAWCDEDATAPPEHVPVMRDALEQAGVSLHDRLDHRRDPRLRPRRAALQPQGVGAALGARPLAPPPQPLTGRPAEFRLGGPRRAIWAACASIGVLGGEMPVSREPGRHAADRRRLSRRPVTGRGRRRRGTR